MSQERVAILRKEATRAGPVVYWMSRDQRSHDNWALLFAQELALQQKEPLAVVFCLVSEFLGATIRQFCFMLKGLQEVEKNLTSNNIPFYVLTGSPAEEIPKFINQFGVAAFSFLSYHPLKASLFQDPTTGQYGITKKRGY